MASSRSTSIAPQGRNSNEILIKLRQDTKASFGLCKEAAEKYPDNYDEAKKYIVELIKERAGKREGVRDANGIIHAYVHGNGYCIYEKFFVKPILLRVN
jgi:translation elongation factor EF-Ts